MELSNILANIYSEEELDKQVGRYSGLINEFNCIFNHKHFKLFSSPGRTEISGNHTDHNHGKVIAASINLDSIAAASVNNEDIVRLYSEGYSSPFVVDLNITTPVNEEVNTTGALVRGIAAGFRKYGYITGGFDAYMQSDVLIGSGLSSSASVEVLIGTIFNEFFNGGSIPAEQVAVIGKYAENNFFGKPCGLMDQIACAVGGIVSIDFSNPDRPVINKIDFDFNATGYGLVVVDSGGSHADLTSDYSSIPGEMRQVAAHFNKNYLREVSMIGILNELKSLREKTGDRAVLRAIHFLEENKRVDLQTEALQNNNFGKFLSLLNESGNSSFKYLQNIYSSHNTSEQGVSLALAITELFIKDKGKGACRVHGGGFAGTILVFIPEEMVEDYSRLMDAAFKSDSIKILSIRNTGAVCLTS